MISCMKVLCPLTLCEPIGVVFLGVSPWNPVAIQCKQLDSFFFLRTDLDRILLLKCWKIANVTFFFFFFKKEAFLTVWSLWNIPVFKMQCTAQVYFQFQTLFYSEEVRAPLQLSPGLCLSIALKVSKWFSLYSALLNVMLKELADIQLL